MTLQFSGRADCTEQKRYLVDAAQLEVTQPGRNPEEAELLTSWSPEISLSPLGGSGRKLPSIQGKVYGSSLAEFYLGGATNTLIVDPFTFAHSQLGGKQAEVSLEDQLEIEQRGKIT